MEFPHIVEILHCVETLPPHRVFYFRGMRSFHVNRPPYSVGTAARDGTAPVSITLPVTITAQR